MNRALHLGSLILVFLWVVFAGQTVFAQVVAIDLPTSKLGVDGENLSYTMGVGDFNGDDKTDFITRVWADEVTPGQHDMEFQTITYAYLNDGTFLWEFHHHMAPNDIGGDPGWVVTLSAWDMDGDNRDEVITQVKENGIIKLIILDGLTGNIKKSTNLTNPKPRNNMQATVAYLNGWNNEPYFVLTYGDQYGRLRTIAFDKDLNEYWRFDSGVYPPLSTWKSPYSWCNIYTCDFDFDQKDEIINGPLLIDNDGSLYLDGTQWHRPHIGSAERSYIADIDPSNPGLEWFLIRVGKDPSDEYYVEPNFWKGPYLIDVDQKSIIWHHNTREKGLGWGRLHHGWVGEIDENVPGLEVWAKGNYFEGTEWEDILAGVYGDLPKKNSVHIPGYSEKWILYAADGTILKKTEGYYVGNPVYWDDDPHAEYYHYRSGTLYKKFDGAVLKKDFPRAFGNGECSQADVLGDWREELIFSSEYTFYVFSNTSPTSYPNRPSLRTDHNYMMNVASIATGLPKVIMRDFNLGPAPPLPDIAKIVFTSNAQTIVQDSVSELMTVQTQSNSGIPINVGDIITLSLSSSSPSGAFSLTNNPFTPVSEIIMNAGSNMVSFYYRDAAIGTPMITVSENPDQGWTDAQQQQTVIVPPDPPVISGFDPTQGSAGTEVAIQGNHFSGAISVRFGGVMSNQYVVESDTLINADVPSGAATGKIEVETPGGIATSTNDFIVEAPPVPEIVIRVNAGGGRYVASNGHEWSADQPFSQGSWGYVGGRTYSTNDAIANTEDDPLYQTERFSMRYYRFTLPEPGRYRARMLFAEIFYNNVGVRRFNVKLEGNRVLNALDIYAEAGHDGALAYEFQVDVTDGILDIETERISDSPKFAAIEVSSSTVPTPEPEISKIVFTTPAQTMVQDSISELMTVQTQSNSGSPVNVSDAVNFSLTSSSPSGEFSLTNNPFTPVSEIIMASDSNNKGFYYRDATVGTPTITVSENPDQGWTDAQQQQTVIALPDPPNITGFDPTQGYVGTEVTITGENFNGATVVRFGGIASNEYMIDSSTQLRAEVPSGATTGKVEIETPGGTATSENDFIIVAPPPDEDFVIRVNAGGGRYVDSDGLEWSTDQAFSRGSWGFVGGRTFTTKDAIDNTNNDPLYQTERYGMPFYRFSVPSEGQYQVRLLFAEIFYEQTGVRQFDVYLERSKVLNSLDIFSEVGHDVALEYEFTVEVTDGVLDIATNRVSDSPKFSAIEVKNAGLSKKRSRNSEENDEKLSTQLLPDKYVLFQNYPNPFNPDTEIKFSIPKSCQVSVVVYNQLGQMIRVLTDEVKDTGTHQVKWNGRDQNGNTVTSGVYFYQIFTDEFTETKKMVFMR